MLINTVGELDLNKLFSFHGDNKTVLEIGDFVYLWDKKGHGGLGGEIVYGTAQVVAIIGKDTYTGERIR